MNESDTAALDGSYLLIRCFHRQGGWREWALFSSTWKARPTGLWAQAPGPSGKPELHWNLSYAIHSLLLLPWRDSTKDNTPKQTSSVFGGWLESPWCTGWFPFCEFQLPTVNRGPKILQENSRSKQCASVRLCPSPSVRSVKKPGAYLPRWVRIIPLPGGLSGILGVCVHVTLIAV